jgi:glycosyltransferase involved in cell wall biosynthesis
MQAELEAAIAESGLGDCVHFNGFVSGDAKAGLLSRTDVFVLPSYNEGLPISILEAMSYGCAIVSTPVGGIPEVVKDNGVLVKPGDIDGIASAIYSLSDPETCLRMGAESSRIVQDFYPEAVMARLRQIYLSLSK